MSKKMPTERPAKLKNKCCKKYRKKSKYCKKCPLYWGTLAKGARHTKGPTRD